MEELARDLCLRADKAFRSLENFSDTYQRAFRLGCPERDGWYKQTEGERKHREIYDSNFADAWERLANAVYTGMCPPWAPWFHPVPGAEVSEEQKDQLLDLLQPHGRAMWTALAQSNYYTELHCAITDLIAGTGHLLTDEHPRKGLYFKAVPIQEVGLEADSFGISGRFWRRKIRGRALRKEFPFATLPQALEDAVRDRPDEDVELLSITVEHPNPNSRFEAIQYIVHEKSRRIIEERPFFENPWSSPRWSVLSGEVYGRGPALKAEPGGYTANEAARLMLLAANISIFGMWLVDAERIAPNVELGAQAMIPVKNDGTDVQTAMRPLVPSTKFDVAQFAQEDQRSQIKRAFYRDNLASVERPGMTATEVMERQALVAQDMGAAYGRLTNELLQPVLYRVSGILARQGKMPQFRMDGKVVGIQYTSALARAQQYEEVVGMRAFLQDVANLTMIDPSAKYVVNAPKFGRKLAGLTGVDLSVTRTEDEALGLATQEAEAQAQLAGLTGGPEGEA